MYLIPQQQNETYCASQRRGGMGYILNPSSFQLMHILFDKWITNDQNNSRRPLKRLSKPVDRLIGGKGVVMCQKNR